MIQRTMLFRYLNGEHSSLRKIHQVYHQIKKRMNQRPRETRPTGQGSIHFNLMTLTARRLQQKIPRKKYRLLKWRLRRRCHHEAFSEEAPLVRQETTHLGASIGAALLVYQGSILILHVLLKTVQNWDGKTCGKQTMLATMPAAKGSLLLRTTTDMTCEVLPQVLEGIQRAQLREYAAATIEMLVSILVFSAH